MTVTSFHPESILPTASLNKLMLLSGKCGAICRDCDVTARK